MFMFGNNDNTDNTINTDVPLTVLSKNMHKMYAKNSICSQNAKNPVKSRGFN